MQHSTHNPKHGFLEFFAGSGLVAEALQNRFKPLWANDFCAKKAAVYRANHSSEVFHLGSIENVKGTSLPKSVMAWASFPCQDLSLAGNQLGLTGGRSGLVWDWLRVVSELSVKPPLLVAENVEGLVSSERGSQYRKLHEALCAKGYKVGAVLLDAVHWVPQSRPRVFVVAVPQEADITRFSDDGANWAHSKSIITAAKGLQHWVWWKMPEPKARQTKLPDLIEMDAPHDNEATSRRNLAMLSSRHQKQLLLDLANGFVVAPGYKRTRNGKQMVELRFDDVAGCLRTPEGGSSRQVLVLKKNGHLVTRLVTVRETARLMGVRDSYKIPGSYNDGYRAMGDAVAVPAVRYLGEHLLAPLAALLSDGVANA